MLKLFTRSRLFLITLLFSCLIACGKANNEKIELSRISSPDNKKDAVFIMIPGWGGAGSTTYPLYIVPKGGNDYSETNLILVGDHFDDLGNPVIQWQDEHNLEVTYSTGYINHFKDCAWNEGCDTRVKLTYQNNIPKQLYTIDFNWSGLPPLEKESYSLGVTQDGSLHTQHTQYQNENAHLSIMLSYLPTKKSIDNVLQELLRLYQPGNPIPKSNVIFKNNNSVVIKYFEPKTKRVITLKAFSLPDGTHLIKARTDVNSPIIQSVINARIKKL